MRSLNYQGYQHLFKVTISHYKHLFLRHEATKPGGPGGAAGRKDVEAQWGTPGAGSGKVRRALSSPTLPGTK